MTSKTGWPPNVKKILNAPNLARRPKETDLKYQLRLVKMAAKADTTAAENRYQSNLARLKLGSLLLVQEPKPKKEKGPWRELKAQELRISGRVLRRILETAQAFQIGIDIPAEVLQRPFNILSQIVETYIQTGEVKNRRKVETLTSLLSQLNRMMERSPQLSPGEREVFRKALEDAAQAMAAKAA